MTLVAFATYGDKAEILTDTTSYSRSLVSMGHCSKVLPLPHLDCAVLTQGSSDFGHWVSHFALAAAGDMPDFPALVTAMGEAVPDAWAHTHWQMEQAGQAPPDPAAAFLIGPVDGEFQAFALSSCDDFEPVRTEGLTIMPVPLNMPIRISEHEAGALTGFANADDIATLRGRPVGLAPPDLSSWIALGLAARETRALIPVESHLKTLVAGQLQHTRIKRGLVTTRTVHTFDDSGEEFAQIVRGTLHPVAQLGLCPWCDSGKRNIDCCLRESFGNPCLCGSGRTIAECCLVDKSAAA